MKIFLFLLLVSTSIQAEEDPYAKVFEVSNPYKVVIFPSDKERTPRDSNPAHLGEIPRSYEAQISTVPLPNGYYLFGLGLFGIIYSKKRKLFRNYH